MFNIKGNINTLRRTSSIKNVALIIALSFFIVIAVGTILLCLPIAREDGKIMPIDSAFAATSATCVTGLVVSDTGQTYTTFGEIVIMLLIQIGGLGYMTLAIAMAVLMGKNLNVEERIQIMESNGISNMIGVGKLARNIMLYTFSVEAIGAILLSIHFALDPKVNGIKVIYYGIFHSISAFCNAGFDIMGGKLFGINASLVNCNDSIPLLLIISSLIIVGGIGYGVFADLIKPQRIRKRTTQTKVVIVTTLVLILGGTLMFLFLEYNNPGTLGNMPFWQKLLNAYFLSVTARTAGFGNIALADLHFVSLSILCFLMYVGGSPSSTAGGIKTTTIALLFASLKSALTKKDDTEIFNRRISTSNVNRAIAVAILAFIFISMAILALNIVENNAVYDLQKALAIQLEVFSAMGTVGLSAGVTPTLSSLGKLILIFVMYVGRIGTLTLFNVIVFSDKTILRRLPEDNLNVG